MCLPTSCAWTATNVGSSYMDCMSTARRGIDSATVTLNGVTSAYDCTGFRLAHRAEWEYAARAGDARATYNGDLDAGHLVCEQPNAASGLHCLVLRQLQRPLACQMGHGRPTHGNLYDMLGNVWEWCWDWYGGVYSAGSVTDPEGPATGSDRHFPWRQLGRRG